MSFGVSKVRSVNYDMLHGVSSDMSGQECTLYGVKKKLVFTRKHVLLLLGNW